MALLAATAWLESGCDRAPNRCRRRLRSSRLSADPLPSWNQGPARQSILDFVARITQEGGPDYVTPAARIAVFDNDGTLWSEKPLPFQLMFALDQVQDQAARHPEWNKKEPFASILKGDMQGLASSGEKGVLSVIAATHAGMTTDEFQQSVTQWIGTARHPGTGRRYTELVYQPMLELLDYLRGERLQDLHRLRRRRGVHAALDRAGVRHSARTGRRQRRQAEVRDARRQARADASCPRSTSWTTRTASRWASRAASAAAPLRPSATPTATCRCCNGPMAGAGPRFALFVHHDDAEREYAYDRSRRSAADLRQGAGTRPSRTAGPSSA